MLRKKVRLVIGVIDSSDQNVFKSELLFLARGVIVASRKQRVEVVATIDRHDLVAHFVRGAVQGNSETNLQRFIGQFSNFRCKTAG